MSRTRNFTFSPFITLCSISLAALMIAASIWQWQRYHYKLMLQEKYDNHAQGQSTSISLEQLRSGSAELIGEKVALTGSFDFERQLIIVNRSNGREPGYWLMTPFRLSDAEDTGVLVSRGFIPFADQDAAAWSKYSLSEIQGTTSIEAVVQPGRPSRNWFAPAHPPGERQKEFKQKWTYVDAPSIAKQLPYPLLEDVYLQQLLPAQHQSGFPQQAIHIGLPPSTHFWYSIEWILLALTALGAGVALQLFPKKNTPERIPATLHSSVLALAIAILVLLTSTPAAATTNPEEVRNKAKIIERQGSTIDLTLQFTDSTGTTRSLADLMLPGRPLLIAPVYFECPELCTLTQNGLAKALNSPMLGLGKDFSLVSLSFNPAETAEFALAKAQRYREQLNALAPEQREHWHFLTGQEEQIKQLTKDIGFYYEKEGNEFIHAAIVAVISPQGMITRYLYGVEFPERDMRLAIVEAADGKIGTITERVMMFCFTFDSVQGRYTLSIMKVVRIVCSFFVILLVSALIWLRLKERQPSIRAN